MHTTTIGNKKKDGRLNELNARNRVVQIEKSNENVLYKKV